MDSDDGSQREPPDDGVARGLAEGRLRTCPDCSAAVSHRLSACHRCGCPFEGAAGAEDAVWQDHEWDSPYRGIRLYRVGLITYVVSMPVGFMLIMLAVRFRSADLTIALTATAGLLVLAAHCIMLAGLHHFASIPGESGAGGMAKVAFSGSLIATVVTALSLLFALTGIMTSALPYLGVVGSIAWVVGSICFILALAGVAKFVGVPDLSGQASVVLVMLLVTIGLNIASDVVSGMIRRAEASNAWSLDKMNEMQGVAIFLLIGLALIAVVYLVKFLQLLATMTAILGEGSDEGEELGS